MGTAIERRDGLEDPVSGGVGSHRGAAARRLHLEPADVRKAALPLERAASEVVRKMPFLWLDVGDEPGPESLTGRIERNLIALLSNVAKGPLDHPSTAWLGRCADRDLVRRSGLWNSNHVDERYDPEFLLDLRRLTCRLAASAMLRSRISMSTGFFK